MRPALPDSLRERGGQIVYAAALVYALVLSLVSWSKYRAFLSSWDQAINAQYVWLLGHAEHPFSTLDGRFIFGDHVQPGLVLLAPLGAIGHVASGLLILQSIALACVAPILYALGRRLGADPALASVVPILWLLSPVVIHPNLDNFHPETIATAFVVLSVLAAVTGRWWWFGVLAVIACSFREDVALLYVGAGLVLLSYGRRRGGIALTATAAAWYLIAGLVILPAFGTAVKEDYGPLFAGGRGHSVSDAIRWSVEHPVTTIAQMFDPNDLGVLAFLALTTAGLCFLAPRWLLLGAPSLLLNFLSYDGDQHNLGHQYYVITATGFAIAGVVGAKRLRRIGIGRNGMLRLAVATGILFAILSWGVIHSATGEGSAMIRADRQAAVAAVPARASVAAPRNFSPHLAERRNVYPLPEPFMPVLRGSKWNAADRKARVNSLQYVIVDTGTGAPAYFGVTPQEVAQLVRSAGFQPTLTRGPVTLYTRVP